MNHGTGLVLLVARHGRERASCIFEMSRVRTVWASLFEPHQRHRGDQNLCFQEVALDPDLPPKSSARRPLLRPKQKPISLTSQNLTKIYKLGETVVDPSWTRVLQPELVYFIQNYQACLDGMPIVPGQRNPELSFS